MPERAPRDHTFVSRGGLKLQHALRKFDVDVRGATCADLGASTGGFTDCLLQHGASRVHAVDTAYGQFAWKLRTDERVTVLERTNALHAEPPPEGVDLVVVDLGWTPQRHAVPAALRWLRAHGRIITLIKPHYELDDDERGRLLRDGALDVGHAETVVQRGLSLMPTFGARVLAHTQSPILGGGSRGKRGKRGGNAEWLALLEPDTAEATPAKPVTLNE